MYKWHVHSAISRGRPVTNDFVRVADGIAASLRLFSVSASRTAGEEGSKPSSRSQRSADAFKEVSSLAPASSRGIDARSLAAKPTSFTIRRVDDTSARGNRGRGDYVSRGGARGDLRGGMRRGTSGRVVMRGRGRGGRGGTTRGRGRGGARGKKPRTMKSKEEDDDITYWDPYTREEEEALVEVKGGYPAPWKPTTSMETLAEWMPSVSSSPRGLIHTAEYKMTVATNAMSGFKTGEHHLREVRGGVGTLFESVEQRTILENFRGPLAKAAGDNLGFYPRKFGSLSDSEKDALNKQWIAGHYDRPQTVEKGDILGQVEAYARRNETYLPEDSRQLVDNIRSRLPGQSMKAKSNPQKSL